MSSEFCIFFDSIGEISPIKTELELNTEFSNEINSPITLSIYTVKSSRVCLSTKVVTGLAC